MNESVAILHQLPGNLAVLAVSAGEQDRGVGTCFLNVLEDCLAANLGHDDIQDFGRKVKIAFSGCEHEACGLVKLHDLGYLAQTREIDGEVERVCEEQAPSPYFKKIKDYPGFESLDCPFGVHVIGQSDIDRVHLRMIDEAVIVEGLDGVRPGKLGDIAPTILALLGEPLPEEMTGDVLV